MRTGANRVALLSGCSSGFGLLTALDMARNGFSVVATMRNLAKRDRLEEAARQAGVSLDVRPLDVTDENSIAACVSGVLNDHGRVDVLVNNAGFALAGSAEDVALAALRAQLETNFFGTAALTKAVLPAMRAARSGRIINVSSVAGRFGSPGLGAYHASKWAVEGWSESLRYEMLPFNVWVSLVEPGFFRTEIFEANRTVSPPAQEDSSPYAALYARMERNVRNEMAKPGADPAEVARLITRIARARRPLLRYSAGRQARLALCFGPMVPQWLMERIRLAGIR